MDESFDARDSLLFRFVLGRSVQTTTELGASMACRGHRSHILMVSYSGHLAEKRRHAAI